MRIPNIKLVLPKIREGVYTPSDSPVPPDPPVNYPRKTKHLVLCPSVQHPFPFQLVDDNFLNKTRVNAAREFVLNRVWFFSLGSLAAFVYQHSLTEISLPCKLVLPTKGKKSLMLLIVFKMFSKLFTPPCSHDARRGWLVQSETSEWGKQCTFTGRDVLLISFKTSAFGTFSRGLQNTLKFCSFSEW